MYKKKITNKLSDLTNKTFGRLTVLGVTYSETLKHRVWQCKCSCGNTVNVPSTALTKGRTTSCGCLKRENDGNKSHGDTNTPIYNRWLAMRNRCKHNKKYYVDRGITVCKEWEDYLTFKKDMFESFIYHSEKYGERNTTLERIDSNKGYYLKNCKWATQLEQSQNLRKPFKITNYKKLQMFLSELSKLKNINLSVSEDDYLLLSYYIRKKSNVE